MKKILFQGDSITDAGRYREDSANLGGGYAALVAATLGYENPGEYAVCNRGISGNRVTDLYARIKLDCICLKPDVISILIGVNDVWHEYDFGDGVDAEKYFKVYSMLIEEIQEALPNTQIVVLEPFALPGTATRENWNAFYSEVKKRAEKVAEIAQKYSLIFIPLQEKFEIAAKRAPEAFWLQDGVHPTMAGHELIKREWLRVFKTLNV